VYFNAAILPGWQKFFPTYRLGVITNIDTAADEADVLLDDALSSAQGLNINQADVLRDVPIEYLDCNAAAFEEGDRVVVKFESQDWDQPKIIGFEKEPRSCGLPIWAALVGVSEFNVGLNRVVKLSQNLTPLEDDTWPGVFLRKPAVPVSNGNAVFPTDQITTGVQNTRYRLVAPGGAGRWTSSYQYPAQLGLSTVYDRASKTMYMGSRFNQPNFPGVPEVGQGPVMEKYTGWPSLELDRRTAFFLDDISESPFGGAANLGLTNTSVYAPLYRTVTQPLANGNLSTRGDFGFLVFDRESLSITSRLPFIIPDSFPLENRTALSPVAFAFTEKYIATVVRVAYSFTKGSDFLDGGSWPAFPDLLDFFLIDIATGAVIRKEGLLNTAYKRPWPGAIDLTPQAVHVRGINLRYNELTGKTSGFAAVTGEFRERVGSSGSLYRAESAVVKFDAETGHPLDWDEIYILPDTVKFTAGLQQGRFDVVNV
jgi:hypothetical protein